MKKIWYPLLITIIVPMNVNAQLLEGLLNSQTESTSRGRGSSGSATSTQPASIPAVTSTATSANCPSSGQTTIPLKFVEAMQRTRGASLQISHDAPSGKLHVRGGDFLSNCNGMLEWGVRNPTGQFPQYILELKIKSCGSETCPFTVMEKNDAGEQVTKEINVAPNFSGFQQCLKDTGVMTDAGIQADKIIIRDLDVSFDRVSNSAPVWFGSHFPEASAVYKKQGESGCYHYEDVTKGGFNVYSVEDSERMRLDQQAQLICEGGNYRHISDFMDRYGQYSSTLGAIRDELISKDYRELAEKIKAGEEIESADYTVVGDFQQYVIDPLTNKIAALHEEIRRMPKGEERTKKEDILREDLKRLASYQNAPYITKKDVDKLMAKGLFEEAAQVNTIHLTSQQFGRIGRSENGQLITPKIARQRIQDGRSDFARNLTARKHEFDVKTGRLTGKSDFYYDLAAQHRRNIQIRTTNYQQEIMLEAQRVSPPAGYCFKYFRNTQKCVNDSMLRIQELRAQLQLYNQSDAEIANDLQAQAEKYDAWENEGRRYVASQSGEEVDPEVAANDEYVPRGPSVEAPRGQTDQGVPQDGYQFQFNNQNMQGQMPTQQQGVMPGMQGFNPYMQQGQQQYGQQQFMAPWWQQQQGQQQQGFNPFAYQQQGQQQMGMNPGMYSFNFGQQAGMQNPYMGQQGYGGNMWGGQQNPFTMPQQGFGMQAGMQWGMGPMSYQSPYSAQMGGGMNFFQ
jgi:hypothetical protein